MSLLILQLSDLHARNNATLADKADAIARAVTGSCPIRDHCLILFSGDIANTGHPAEYVEAGLFLSDLKRILLERGVNNVSFAAIPGNHDCNLEKESDTRRFLLDSIEAYLSREIDYSGSNFQALMDVQQDFFEFEQSFSHIKVPEGKDRLYYRRTLQIGQRSILLHCFNTAWLSKRREEQAKLYLPVDTLREPTAAATTLSVAMLHHPYNWLNAENSRRVEAFISDNVDLVLSGHEHEADVVMKSRQPDSGVMYFSAPALDDPKAPENGFQTADIDFDTSLMVVTQYLRNGESYQTTTKTEWPFSRSKQRPQNPYSFQKEWLDKLEDIGTGFNHPRCSPPNCKLHLSDLYVFPDLRRVGLDQALSKEKIPNVQGKDVFATLAGSPKSIVYGAETSGKSSLAKIVAFQLHESGVLPVLLNGLVFKSKIKDTQVLDLLKSSITAQYNCSDAEAFLQADTANKAVIIDDFEDARLTLDSQKQLLSLLEQRFAKIIVFASDIFQIQDSARSDAESAFAMYDKYSIRQFGAFHRYKLLRKWLAIGRTDIDELAQLDRDTQETDKTIATLLGRNVLPHLPVTILTLLQMMGSKDALNTANGAYGYLYETLLKASLAKINPRKVDEMVTYLSRVGYAMFKSKEPVLSEEAFRDVHRSYCDAHDMDRDFDKYISDFQRAGVISEEFGAYSFKYPYEYFYSVAKYYVDQSLGLRSELIELTDHLYNENNANILIFYVYLTKDVPLIEHMVSGASKLYSNWPILKLDDDVVAIDKLCTDQPPPLILESGAIEERRDTLNRKRDDAAERELAVEDDENHHFESDEVRDLVQIGVAFRTLQILGQVLRNFTGSLEGPVKLQIIAECYRLGMRTLSFVLSYMHDVSGIRQYIGSLIAERTGVTDEKDLANQTDDVILWLSRAATFGAIKRVSYAVGHADLTRTYAKALAGNDTNSIRMIDATIKMDHLSNAPEADLKTLANNLRKRPFAKAVMRDLVADFLYLYENDFRVMQRIGSQWNIQVQQPKFLSNRSKR